ncbi:DMT family transporter [Erythrobacter sp. R86502]|uniref:DMT family transporter n=1 Tax=Erythrobacter sp. R86502 TaxID=3093846 RepID=UPI0036D3A8CB
MRGAAITLALASLAIAAFAGNSLLARAALGEGAIGAGAFSAIRLAAGAIILLPVIGRWPRRGDWSGALALAIYVAGFSFAYRTLDAGTGALILFAAVQATILLVGHARGEALTRTGWAGIAAAMAGLVVLLAPGGTAFDPLAAGLMGAAGAAWGAYTLLGRSRDDPAGRTARSFLLAAPLMLPLVWWDASAAGHLLAASRNGALLAAISGAITSGLGYVVWYTVIPRLRLATVASVQLATPVVAALGGAVWLAEPVGWRMIAGGGLVLGGIMLTLAKPRPAPL